ncbi:MAG: RsmD family RNA methyltransferase [Chitinophagales bacterium]|jgi:16S rRNA (guanine(966)-N(2))-methyltransferase RsmD|nr:RsmD family RNA methyltransferase [Chitinophagales bacterium]
MRIIAGKFKGYILNQPYLSPTRPTTNFAKEALFSIVDNYFNFENIKFLDLFSGTGSVTIEFASRGCLDITSVELFSPAVTFIKQTVEKLEITGHKIFQMDVWQYIQASQEKYDVIFAGPPYKMPNLDKLPDFVIAQGLILDQGWFILEHNQLYDFTKHPNFWQLRKYGGTHFSFFVNNPINYG